jgi:integral membrane protein (TIGR00529 family)
MLTSSHALLISIVGIIVLLRLKLHPGLAIFIGSLIISILVLPLRSLPELIFNTAINEQTITLLIIIASAMTLSRLMELKGLLTQLAANMERIGPRLALLLTPSIIGFVPMPAGALVSATAMRDLVKRMRLNPEQATFINYWFRHIWELFLPVYPAIITASVIFSIPITSLMITLLPMAALATLLGIIITISIIKPKVPPSNSEKPANSILYGFFKAAWPVLLLITIVLLGLNAAIAFPLTLALLALQQKAKWLDLKQSFKYGLDPKILLLLYAVMLYKATIETSGAADELFTDMQSIGLPAVAILVTLPFLISFSTGNTMAFVGISFPLLFTFIASGSQVNIWALLLAFISGEVGYILSPLHLCLVLSTQYFEASLSKVYRYLVPPLFIVESVAILIYYLGTA